MIAERFSRCQTTGARVRSAAVTTAASGIHPRRAAGPVVRRRSPRPTSPRRPAPRPTSTAPRRSGSAWRRFDARVRRRAARHPLCAEGELHARAASAAAGTGQRRRREFLAARSRSRCGRGSIPEQRGLHRRGQDADELRRAVPARPQGRSTRSRPGELDRHRRDRARSPAPARASRCASTPTSRPAAHPHISTGRRIDKFGVPIELGRGPLPEAARHARPATGRRSRAHRVADHRRSRPLQAGGRGAGGVRRRPARGRHRARAPRPRAAGSASCTTAPPTADDRRLRRGGPARRPRRPASRSCSSRAARSSARRRAAGARVDIKAYFDAKPFAVLDAGMTELIRPALYGAYHRIEPVAPRAGRRRGLRRRRAALREQRHRSGRTGDLPPLEVGDLVAVFDAGAYGSTMASTYNRRPLAVRGAGGRRDVDDHPPAADGGRDGGERELRIRN